MASSENTAPAPETEAAPAPQSLIRQLLQHRLDQLQADIREAEQEVVRAEESQASVIREQAARKARLVDRDALIAAEIGVNIAKQLVEGKKKLLKAEQRHQQTVAIQSQITRYEKAMAEAATAGDWAALWTRCIPLVERAARSYIRTWKAILKARQEWEQPHQTMAAALQRCGLPPQETPRCDIGRNFQEVWTAATAKVTAEVSRNGQPETDLSHLFFGGRVY